MLSDWTEADILRIAIFTRELNNVLGGMEKQLLQLATKLTDAGHTVTVFSLDLKNTAPFYSYDYSSINFWNIAGADPKSHANLKSKITRQIATFKAVRDFKPDIAITFMFGAFLYSRIPTFLNRVPLIISERNSPTIYKVTRVSKFKHLIFLSMLFSKKITVQFERFESFYPFYLRRKIVTIPNFLAEIKSREMVRNQEFTFLFAGRFSFQKQVSQLLQAYLEFAEKYPDTKFRIIGKGEDSEKLKEMVLNHKNGYKVQILEPMYEVSEILNGIDVLCITSIWEGFPNILAEALVFGIPAIGFSNCDGVADLIEDGYNGWLEKDDGQQSTYIRLLERGYLASENLDKFSINARRSMEVYDNELSIAKWLEIIN